MSKISEYSDNSGSVYVSGTDDETTEEIRISFVEPQMTAWRDFSPQELVLLRSMIDDALEELFEKMPSIQCPGCGYTQADAGLHMDHRLCRFYPFFPGETGKSEAVSK